MQSWDAPRSRVVPAVAGLAVAGLGLVGCGGGSADPAAGTARSIRHLDRDLRQALVAGDAAALDQVLARDFVLIPPPGEEGSRADYVESVASGDLDYEEFRAISPVRVRVSGSVAVATYESHLSVDSGGFHAEHDAWHTHVYEQQDGTWRLVWAQATAVGGFPPPAG